MDHNKKYTLVFETNSSAVNEAAQRLSFSFGYKWSGRWGNENEIRNTDARYLYFNSLDKKITWGHYTETAESSSERPITSDFATLLEFFKEKPTNIVIDPRLEITPDGRMIVYDLDSDLDFEFDKNTTQKLCQVLTETFGY